MQVVNLENSRRLYELSKWEIEYLAFWRGEEDKPLLRDYHKGVGYQSGDCPAYTLGYLLRKLPIGTHVFKTSRGYGASIGYRESKHFADTPEDCLAMLAIKLLEEGKWNLVE